MPGVRTISLIIITVILTLYIEHKVRHWLSGHQEQGPINEDLRLKVEKGNIILEDAQEEMKRNSDSMKEKNRRKTESAKVDAEKKVKSAGAQSQRVIGESKENSQKVMEHIEKGCESASKQYQKNLEFYKEENQKTVKDILDRIMMYQNTARYGNQRLLEYDEESKDKGKTSRWSLL